MVACLPTLALAAMALADPPVVVVDRDNVAITESCTVEIGAAVIADDDGDGVIHITADDIVVDFAGATLSGAPPERAADEFAGLGIVITGDRVTLRNARVRGFKGGIFATGADDLTIEDCDISGNFRQRLRSTPEAEDGADWLYPHHNQENQWLSNYGAGLYVEESARPILRRIRCREGQNGIVLDTVTQGQIYDNDCSFLSGWGLAMWKSSMNIITRNAFDFCVRGYSHGVYNRGQDSAGILMFEQNCDNVIAENSVTHGGDGIFGFAGVEALGDLWLDQEGVRLRNETGQQEVDHLIAYPRELLEELHRQGNNRNVIINNDLSYAPAHGLEMTFSFDNQVIGNRFVENAICGIWGGYSQDTLIAGNDFIGNGEMAYGLERGGVNIEHGIGNIIVENTFERNKAGVHLWWDEDTGLVRSPWGFANTPGTPVALREDGSVPRMGDVTGRLVPSKDNVIAQNTFMGDEVAIHLRDAEATYVVANTIRGEGEEMRNENSQVIERQEFVQTWHEPRYPVLGETKPIGARSELAGRDKIIMTEWGPYDWRAPMLHLIIKSANSHKYRLLGNEEIVLCGIERNVEQDLRAHGQRGVHAEAHRNGRDITITSTDSGTIVSYVVVVSTETSSLEARGVLVNSTWNVSAFPYESDPRDDVEAWHVEAKEHGVTFEADSLDFRFGGGGPISLADIPDDVVEASIGGDQFGVIATTSLAFPAGAWRIRTSSDDGIRVWVNDELVIDDWTHHVPTRHYAVLTFDQPTQATIRVEYFELTGHAELMVEIEPAD